MYTFFVYVRVENLVIFEFSNTSVGQMHTLNKVFFLNIYLNFSFLTICPIFIYTFEPLTN